jgi:hypothetical protein
MELNLDGAYAYLFAEVLGVVHREGGDRHGGFCHSELTKRRHQRRRGFVVMALARRIEDAASGIVAYAAGAELVDAVAG